MSQHPNILFICTDQQSASMMSCAGNQHLHTPAMDGLAERGVRFDRAYCTNPLCLPSRFSLMTGRMLGALGVRGNRTSHIEGVPSRLTQAGLGHLLGEAGYRTGYGGKIHLPHMHPTDLGFDYLCSDSRGLLAERCSEFIAESSDRPFFLFASFINPHDICYMAIRDFAKTDQARALVERGRTEMEHLDRALERPGGMTEEEFLRALCPPLPENFEPQENEPGAIGRLLEERPFRKNARENYTPERWRLHRRAYCRLTEMVDAEIGQVLQALRATGRERETVVIFTSDHGDMDSAHRMEHKTALYEEASRIPLIIAAPGTSRPATVDAAHLVSNGLDLFPTVCDFAGVPAPKQLRGRSLRPLAEGDRPDSWREAVLLESQIGRAMVTENYKYALYDQGENREQLYDREADPGEMRNAAIEPAHSEALKSHRELFRDLFSRIEDDRLMD